MVSLAPAFATGIALGLSGLLLPALALGGVLLLRRWAPRWLWTRPPGSPTRRPLEAGALGAGSVGLFLLAGCLAGWAAELKGARDCRLALPRTGSWTLEGRLESRPQGGALLPFRVDAGLPEGCRGVIRVLWPRGLEPPPTGARIQLTGEWEGRAPEALRRSGPPGSWGERVGRFRVATLEPMPRAPRLQGAPLRFRGAVQDRIHRLFGSRAPMVEALVLARREHLDPDLREAFALSGTAHLLAISGFHVGVFAGLLLGLFRLLGVLPQRALPMAAVGSWIYVLSIGAPDAAARAALLFTLLAMARLRGVPPMSVGTLATALLVLLLMNPGALVSVGFQLSFAGTWGILVLRKPVSGLLKRGWEKGGGAPDRSPLSWLKDGTDGLAAGISATLPTLPLLAWHFDRISLVGIPATLLAAPLVSLAIPGIAATLALSVVAPVPATFLAGGVVLLLDLLRTMVVWAAELPGASLWVSRGGLLLFLGGGGAVLLLLRLLGIGRIRARARWGVSTLVGFAALLLRPILPGPERMELHLLDVGQGDALALRLPDARWVLVDAGPSGGGFDAGARRVVPHLRREGVRRVDLLVLSHAHLDHLGGAPAVLRNLEVGGVLEPARLHPSQAYREALGLGRTRQIPWWPAQAGTSVLWGEVRFSVLHPDPAHPEREANEDSVILLVEWGEIAILLTGDAYGAQEVALLPNLPPLTVLKAGHHGSRTSTSQPLLDRTRPELTLLSLGDGNRYGHPHAEVMDRLKASGTRVIRTDWDGSTVIRLTRGGRWSLR